MPDPHKPEDGLEGAVVDVARGAQVPPLDGHDHAREHVLARGARDRPRMRAVGGHVREHAGGVVADLREKQGVVTDRSGAVMNIETCYIASR